MLSSSSSGTTLAIPNESSDLALPQAHRRREESGYSLLRLVPWSSAAPEPSQTYTPRLRDAQR